MWLVPKLVDSFLYTKENLLPDTFFKKKRNYRGDTVFLLLLKVHFLDILKSNSSNDPTNDIRTQLYTCINFFPINKIQDEFISRLFVALLGPPTLDPKALSPNWRAHKFVRCIAPTYPACTSSYIQFIFGHT